MAVVYRAEKKKILRSQINLIQKVIQIIKHCEATLTKPEGADNSRAFTDLILSPTHEEIQWRTNVQNDSKMSDEAKNKELIKLEE